MLKMCEVCGRQFKARRDTQKTCSLVCRGKARRVRVTLTCQQCGGFFDVPASIAARSHYCSRACYAASGQPAKNAPNTRRKKQEGETPGRKRVYLGKINGKPTYMPRSHAVWNKTHPDDPIGPSDRIHHIDHNEQNDDPANLFKMSMDQHQRYHALLIPKSERSRRKKAYFAANPGIQRKGTPNVCKVCGKSFYRPPSASQVTCSYECSGKWSWMRKRGQT